MFFYSWDGKESGIGWLALFLSDIWRMTLMIYSIQGYLVFDLKKTFIPCTQAQITEKLTSPHDHFHYMKAMFPLIPTPRFNHGIFVIVTITNS